MTDERQSGLLFESWLKGTDPTPPDASRSVAQVMAWVPQTRQRGRWWPLPASERPAPIPATDGRQPARGFTMFSAVKFMVASVIVALFGGFLLAGVFTMQQGDEVVPAAVTASPTTEATSEPMASSDPSVRSDILPGVALTVEEVEPGIFHVVNDGVRPIAPGRNTDIVAGHDDGIWLLQQNRFFRLGAEKTHEWQDGGGPYRADFEVSPDGTVWVLQSDEGAHWGHFFFASDLFSFDGDRWTRTQSPPGEVHDVVVAPDGTVWAAWGGDDGGQVGHLGPTGWQPLDVGGEGPYPAHPLFLTDSGDLYGGACAMGCWLNRYEDGAWRYFLEDLGLLDIAPDGTIWQLGNFALATPDGGIEPGQKGEGLARFAGGEWELWRKRDLPDMGLSIALDYEFEVAPDGSLWASLWQPQDDAPEQAIWGVQEWPWMGDDDGRAVCDGLVRFDGESVGRYLSGRCIAMDIAADGSVWVLADEDKGKGLYVITPEAVAGTE